MSSVADRLSEEVEAKGLSQRRLAELVEAEAGEGVKGTSEASVRNYLSGKVTSPPLEWIGAAACVLNVRPEWLAFGTGPRTEAEAERDSWIAFTWGGDPGPDETEGGVRRALKAAGGVRVASDKRTPYREAALGRFLVKLADLSFPGAPWEGDEDRQRLLEAAAIFILAVDRAIDGGEKPPVAGEEDEPEWWWDALERGRLARVEQMENPRPPLVLDWSESPAWWGIWYDAALELFSRRVIGLGERAGGLYDDHTRDPSL